MIAERCCNRDSPSSMRILWSAVIVSPNCVAGGGWPSWFSGFILQGALVIFVRTLITLCGSLGKCVSRLRSLPFLLEDRGFGRGVSGGCSRSLPDDFEFLPSKPSVISFTHSSMSRNRLPDAVCRTRPPEAELMLVSPEPSADTEITSSLVAPGAIIGANLSDLQQKM